MITHLAMASLPNSRNVLVIGGGDGGVPREAIKHPSVEEVTMMRYDRIPKHILLLSISATPVAYSNKCIMSTY
jgi:spermidine synthase